MWRLRLGAEFLAHAPGLTQYIRRISSGYPLSIEYDKHSKLTLFVSAIFDIDEMTLLVQIVSYFGNTNGVKTNQLWAEIGQNVSSTHFSKHGWILE